MKQKHTRISRAAVLCAAAVLVLALATAGYAADVGGIQRTVQVWTHGDQTDAVIQIENGSYELYYQDADGTPREQSGGGVAYDFFGRERPLTAEELMTQLNQPEVEYRDDGSVWVYYRDQSLEITDLFKDGICRVELKDENGKALYMTVEYGGGYSMSSHHYIAP